MKLTNGYREKFNSFLSKASYFALAIYDRLCLIFVCLLFAVVAIFWPDIVRDQLKNG